MSSAPCPLAIPTCHLISVCPHSSVLLSPLPLVQHELVFYPEVVFYPAPAAAGSSTCSAFALSWGTVRGREDHRIHWRWSAGCVVCHTLTDGATMIEYANRRLINV